MTSVIYASFSSCVFVVLIKNNSDASRPFSDEISICFRRNWNEWHGKKNGGDATG